MGDTDAAIWLGFRRESLTVSLDQDGVTLGHTHRGLRAETLEDQQTENMVPAARPIGIDVADSVKPSRKHHRLICRLSCQSSCNCPYSLRS